MLTETKERTTHARTESTRQRLERGSPLPDCLNTCANAFVLAAVTDDRIREAVRTPTGEQGC